MKAQNFEHAVWVSIWCTIVPISLSGRSTLVSFAAQELLEASFQLRLIELTGQSASFNEIPNVLSLVSP